MSVLRNSPPLPELRPLQAERNAGFPTIRFQFPPESYQEDHSGNWASATSLGRDKPILHFASGEQESFSFEAKLYARHEGESIEDLLDVLKRAPKRDSTLGRPPRWEFVWGSILHETVIVKSVGNIRFDEIRSDGSIRGASLQIELWNFVPNDVELTSPGTPPPSTFYVITKTNDSWEDLALREYRDPRLGDLLRRRNPSLMFPGATPGKIVKLIPEDQLRLDAIEPYSGPLQRTPDGLALRQQVHESRARSRESVVLIG